VRGASGALLPAGREPEADGAVSRWLSAVPVRYTSVTSAEHVIETRPGKGLYVVPEDERQ
jgi:hypothetical protein